MNVDDLHTDMMRRFDGVDERLDTQNGRIKVLELWQARMEGARLYGVGVWQALGTGAAVIAAGVAVALAVVGGGS